jgi:hypothetical protein
MWIERRISTRSSLLGLRGFLRCFTDVFGIRNAHFHSREESPGRVAQAYNEGQQGFQMPRFKPKGMLERNALADLWKHTLSQIPSTYGRLAYLASLRDANSGVYRHHGLSASFGREESVAALRKSHEDTFREWLSLALSFKSADLIAHFQNVQENPRQVVTYLARATPYLSQIPDSASPAQRRQFKMEMEILLELLKNDSGGERFPDSARPA